MKSRNKKLLVLGITLLLIFSLSLSGCLSKPSSASTSNTTSTSLTSLERDVAQVEEDISNLWTSVTGNTNQIGDLQNQINNIGEPDSSTVDDLQSQINALKARVEDLEEDSGTSSSGDGSSEELGEVRWVFDDVEIVGTFDDTLDIETYTDWHGSIEEEGIYDITIIICNEGDGSGDPLELDNKLALVLSPRDDAFLDEDSTYLDTDESPWITWDADFIVKTRAGQDITRRVEFYSDDEFQTTIEDGECWEIDLILELYYDYD